MVAPIPSSTLKFPLGNLFITPGAAAALERSGQTPLSFLSRHAAGDWGDVDADDWRANDQSLTDGTRLVSAYRTIRGEKLWVITECDRSATTLLLPDEY
jgi:hypothetical protein